MIIGTAMIAPYLRCIPGSSRAVGSYDGQTRRPGATPTSLDAGPFSLPDRTIIAPLPPNAWAAMLLHRPQAPYRLARLHAGARTSLAGRSGSDSSARPTPISS